MQTNNFQWTYIKIAVIYLAAAVLWILSFEIIINVAISDPAERQHLFLARGLVLAGFTGIFLFIILRKRDSISSKLEDAIASSEEIWRTTFEEANDPIFILDKDLMILRSNNTATELYGYTEEEFRKMSMRNLRSDTTSNNISMSFLGVTKNTGYKFHTIHRKKDGTVFPVEVSTKASVHNNMLQYIDIVHDLSDREKMEKNIRDNRQRLSGIVDSAMDAVITVGSDKKIILFNRAAERMFLCSSQEAIGSDINRFVPETYRAGHNAHIEKFGKTGETSRGMGKLNPISGVRSNGDEFPIEASISHIEVEGEKLYTVILRDVTEKMKAEKSVNEARIRLNSIVDSAMDAIITIGVDRKIVLFNRSAEKMFLCMRDEAIGDDINRFIPERLRQMHNTHLQRFDSTGETSRSMGALNPISGLRSNGEEFPIEASISQVAVQGEKLYTVILRDITEKMKAEKLVNEARIRLNSIVDSAMDAIITMGVDRKILLFNSSAEKMFLCKREEAIGGDINRFIPERFRKMHNQHVEHFGETGETSRSMGALNSISGLRANNEEFPIEASISQVVVNGEKLYTVILRDVTSKIRYEESLRESNERLHDLAAHLQTIREDERKMLAREIHDQLGQELTALKIDIALLGKKIKKMEESPETIGMLENIEGMGMLTDHTINTVRRIATELRPDMLDKLGLKEAIYWMAEDFEKRSGIKCILNLPDEFGFDGNLDTTIFRIIQESLTNTARHSGASEVSISAEINNVIRVIIEDNGKGIIDEEIKNTKSLGLLGIRERAYSHDGVFTIETGRKKGAKFVLTIPLKKETRERS